MQRIPDRWCYETEITFANSFQISFRDFQKIRIRIGGSVILGMCRAKPKGKIGVYRRRDNGKESLAIFTAEFHRQPMETFIVILRNPIDG